MPIFDFICTKCGKTEERLVSRSELDSQKCACGEDSDMVKSDNISRTNFTLKGVWFKTHKQY